MGHGTSFPGYMCLALLSWGAGQGAARKEMSSNASQWMAAALARRQAACPRLLDFPELSNDGLAIGPAVCTSAPQFLCQSINHQGSQGQGLWFSLFRQAFLILPRGLLIFLTTQKRHDFGVFQFPVLIALSSYSPGVVGFAEFGVDERCVSVSIHLRTKPENKCLSLLLNHSRGVFNKHWKLWGC